MNYRTNTGRIHYGRPSRVPGYVQLLCSGRSMAGCLPTDEPVTCASCARATGLELEPRSVDYSDTYGEQHEPQRPLG